MDGIEETKAGNGPVSAFRATFLRHHALRTPCSGIIGHTGARIWACARARSGYYAAATAGSATSLRAHIDESRRSRVMASGNWPVRFCPLKSLQESAGCRDS